MDIFGKTGIMENRIIMDSFQEGTAAYDYVWTIIRHVYGEAYPG